MTQPKRSTLSALFLLAGVCGAASAQSTWYVDVQAVPPGNGSQVSPYASLSYAVAQPSTVTGDTLLVAPGTYKGPVTVEKGVSVVSTHGPEHTRILWDGLNENTVGLLHAQALLKGFTVQGLDQGGAPQTGVFLGHGAKLERCVVTGFVWPGGYGVGVDDGVIDHCTVIGNSLAIVPVLAPFFPATLHMTNSIVDQTLPPLVQGTVNHCAGLGLDPHWSSVGVGNLPVDPQTLFANFGDAHLASGSPCIDAASPASPLDPDGSPADIGALTFVVSYAPGPKVYCTGKLHSQGCVTQMSFQGQPSLSQTQPFLVTASQAPSQQIGLLFYGFGPRAMPLWGGLHCVQPPTPRTVGQFSGGAGPCAGNFSFDFQSWMTVHGDPQFVPGAAVFAQYWFRDPLDPQGFGIGLSDALSFLIAP